MSLAVPDGRGGFRVNVQDAIDRLKDLEWAASNLAAAWARVPLVARKGLGTVYIRLDPEAVEVEGGELIELEAKSGTV